MIGAWSVLVSELAGTATMMALGVGTNANISLPRTAGRGSSYLMAALGWALGVYAGIYVASGSGAHLNPAITLAMVVQGRAEFAPGVAVGPVTTAAYLGGQLAGAMLGSAAAWCAYRLHFALVPPGADTVTVFATAPGVRSLPANAFTEAIATFGLVFVVLHVGGTPSGLGPLATALVVLGIGLGLGGPTSWALNPARDLGARLAHALLPIEGKGSSDWRYAWVPVVGPLVGGAIAGLVGPVAL